MISWSGFGCAAQSKGWTRHQRRVGLGVGTAEGAGVVGTGDGAAVDGTGVGADVGDGVGAGVGVAVGPGVGVGVGTYGREKSSTAGG